MNEINKNMLVLKKYILIFDKDVREKVFCCSCFYDQYIIQINEKKRHFRNNLIRQLYLVHHQKKDYFCVQSHKFYHVCYDCIHDILFVFSSLEYQATKILDDTCYRTMHLRLKSNCVIKHYPILNDVVYDPDFFDKFCHLCRFEIVTKLIKHKLHVFFILAVSLNY